jgi:hypothetical protein
MMHCPRMLHSSSLLLFPVDFPANSCWFPPPLLPLFLVLGLPQTDPMSYHGGCPPIKGIKWAANSWIWNVPTRKGYSQWKFD